MLHAAVEHARRGGAQIVEAYPVEPETRMHNGDAFTCPRSMYERVGFRETGRFDRLADAAAPERTPRALTVVHGEPA